MTVLDFTKKTTPVIDKLIKLGFHYESTDKAEAEGIRNPPQLITIPRKYVRITDDCTNISVTMSVEEFMELERITNSNGSTFPRPETSFKRITNEN